MVAPPAAPSEVPAATLVDTHAHLNDRRFAGDVDAVIERALDAGIGAMVVVGFDLESSQRAVNLSERYPSLWAAVGVHPHHATDVTPDALSTLERLAQHERVVAIGECGLDYYRDLSPRPIQCEAFAAQLDLAKRVGLPVIVHSREAMEETFDVLSRARPAGGVMHCFDGTPADASRALDLGLFISCAGPLTYRKDPTLASAIASVPADRLVVETDCPWLSPVGHRGERNEPALVQLVAAAAARARGERVQDLAAQTTRNAAQLFQKPALANTTFEVAA